MIKGAKDMMRKIIYILDKKQKKQIVFLFIAIIFNTLFETLGVSAIFPLISVITDPVILNENKIYVFLMNMIHIGEAKTFILYTCIFIILIYVIKNIYILWMNAYLYRFIYHSQRLLSERLIMCYMKQEYIFHVKHNVAELQRNIGDTEVFFATVKYLIQFLTELCVCFALIVYLSITDFKTTIIVAFIMAILLLLFISIYKKRMKLLGERSREMTYIKGKWILQIFNGVKEIKTLDREKFFLTKFSSAAYDSADVMYKQVTLSNAPKPIVEMVCICAMMIYMAIRIAMGEETTQFVPILSVFAMAAFRMLPSFNRISGDLSSIMYNKPSVDAVYKDILEVEELQKEKEDKDKESGIEYTLDNSIEITGISFAYPTKANIQVLKDVNMIVPAKKSVAIVGPSGAGKTTIADIILGLYHPQKGSITSDGVDIYNDLRGWHKIIGYIPQSIYLIDDTIRANIAFGIPKEEVNDDRIWKVLKDAQLDEYVRSQKDGLDAMVGDRGIRISGGQRQRIGIARALYTEPQLLIMDEATSALDNETEKAVMESVEHLSGKITMVIIAHRLTTIKSCDIIYRIANGVAKKISYEEAVYASGKTE